MKKKILAAAALFLITLSCNSSGDILARMEGHVIKRGEFYAWLESRGLHGKNIEDIMEKSETALLYLEQFAVEKLTAEKAVVEGFDSEPYFKKVEELVFRNYTASFYRNRLKANLKFSSKAADISIISIDYSGDSEDESFRSAMSLIRNSIIPELEKGTSFDAAAEKYSRDESASKGGRLGFIIPSMYGDYFANKVFGLRKNEFSREPLLVNNSLLIIKVNDYAEVNEKNIEKVMGEGSDIERIKNYMSESALKEKEKSFMERWNVNSRIDEVSWSTSDDIIFSVDGESFTVAGLDEILGISSHLKYGSRKSYMIPAEEKAAAGRMLLWETLLVKAASAEGIDSEPEFIEGWEILRRSVLSGAYKYRKFSEEITITRNDALKEYKRLADSRESGNGGKTFSFSQVENRIREELFKSAMLSLKNEWDKKVLKDARFSVDDN